MKKLFCLLLIAMMLVSSAWAAGLTEFTTTDMEGNIVTQDIFADYDLTVVNIWATWCGYCLEEMPELAKLKSMFPENVNFITLCEDAHLDMELANNILQSAGADFQTLVNTEEIHNQFLLQFAYLPTTVFLDSEGMPVAAPIVGVPSLKDAAEAYYNYTMAVLNEMETAS